ncbi:MAG: hypothetical protein RIR70_1346 [Pseudomonadota bacterium]
MPEQQPQGLEKIARECARGAFVLGSALGSANALYARAVRYTLAGSVPPALKPAVAMLPALGVGATSVSDAVSAKALGAPTDPEGVSNKALAWVAPVVMGLSFASYRYAPIKKPAPGSVKDMAAQVVVASIAGALTYTTREWMAQRSANAARKGVRQPLKKAGVSEPKPDVLDRLAARTATQVLAVGMRLQILSNPALGPRLYLPALVASCAPYGWRDELSQKIAQTRSKV